MIESARSFLDAAEELLDDPERVQSLVDAVSHVAAQIVEAGSSLTAKAFPSHPTGEDEQDAAEPSELL